MSFMFVFGPARTGTSALTWELNAAGDVFVIPELNAAFTDPVDGRTPSGKHFVREYVDRVFDGNMAIMQGKLSLFLPGTDSPSPACIADFLSRYRLPGDLLRYVAGIYKVVGTKIAMFSDRQKLDLVYQYQRIHHQDDLHLATWRAPDQVLRSAALMFPAMSRNQLLSNLLAACAETLRLISEFPRRIVVPHGTVTIATLNAIRRRVDLPAVNSLAEIDPQYVNTHDATMRWETREQESLFACLCDAHDRFLSALSWSGGVADLDRAAARELREYLLGAA